MNRSRTLSTAVSGSTRARSILLTKTIGRRPCSRAFFRTNGSGVSAPHWHRRSAGSHPPCRGHAPLHADRRDQGVDDVDPCFVVSDGRVLRQDRDATLTLQVVGIQHTGYGFVVAENSGLCQQRVDQGRLAMVNVGDDRDVANRLVLGAYAV